MTKSGRRKHAVELGILRVAAYTVWFHHAEPIFETMPARDENITGCRTFEELPQRAQDYVLRLEELSSAPKLHIDMSPGWHTSGGEDDPEVRRE
nr:adenylosuccinate synthetase [Streptococcus thermophilus]